MLLTVGRLIEFTRFLQIFCWIFLPTLFVAIILTAWHHRRQRKRNRDVGEKETIDFLLAPDPSGEGSYVLFDHSNLIRNYRDQLSYNHARYAALLQDFKKLEMKHLKNEYMENSTVQTQPAAVEVIDQQVGEHPWMADIMEEKKAQIDFLQGQLEQRIKNYHHSEKARETIQVELEQMKQAHQHTNDEFQSLSNELTQKREAVGSLEALLEEKQRLLISKLDHIVWLETAIEENRHQNQMLDARMNDQQDLLTALQEKLGNEESRANHAEQRLARNTRLLQKLHRVMASCISSEADETQVIELKPVYANIEEHNWAEQAL